MNFSSEYNGDSRMHWHCDEESNKRLSDTFPYAFIFEEFRKKRRQREGERNNLGTGTVKVSRELEDTMFAFRQQVHLAS